MPINRLANKQVRLPLANSPTGSQAAELAFASHTDFDLVRWLVVVVVVSSPTSVADTFEVEHRRHRFAVCVQQDCAISSTRIVCPKMLPLHLDGVSDRRLVRSDCTRGLRGSGAGNFVFADPLATREPDSSLTVMSRLSHRGVESEMSSQTPRTGPQPRSSIQK